jgi:hypothetical protein
VLLDLLPVIPEAHRSHYRMLVPPLPLETPRLPDGSSAWIK